MSLLRLLILTVGPFVIVTVAYWIAAPHSSAAVVPQPTSASQNQQPRTDRRSVRPRIPQTLADRCQTTARRLRESLPAGFAIATQPPFVIAGDLPKPQLEQIRTNVIGPVSRALQATYFTSPPQYPISIVICSTEEIFRQLAQEWDGHLDAGYHGYYQRDKRRVLLDLEAGNGSLAHELTHALSHADCPLLPEWFDEGLGALHEEAQYAPDGHRLIGLPNWRCSLTRRACQTGRLPPVRKLADPQNFRSGDVGLNYAVSRSICLFLQDRRVLTEYYQALKTRSGTDPHGLRTLCRILGVTDEDQFERQFAAWIKRQPR